MRHSSAAGTDGNHSSTAPVYLRQGRQPKAQTGCSLPHVLAQDIALSRSGLRDQNQALVNCLGRGAVKKRYR